MCSFRKERLSVQVLDHGLDQEEEEEEEEEEFASLVKELSSDVSPQIIPILTWRLQSHNPRLMWKI